MADKFNLKLEKFDTLMGADSPSVINVPISKLHTFKNHPFKVLDDEYMDELVESVKENGVLSPALVRPTTDDEYELISGHRRKHACELAGIREMPVIVQDLTDDEATVIMVDSNIQREELLPSEKAFAYKMKLEAMKRKAGRLTVSISMEIDNFLRKEKTKTIYTKVSNSYLAPDATPSDRANCLTAIKHLYTFSGGSYSLSNDTRFSYNGSSNGIAFEIRRGNTQDVKFLTWSALTERIAQLIRTNNYLSENSAQIEQKKTSVEILAEEVGESRATVQRLIRLTNLRSDLLDMVDDKALPVNVGVELSYLSPKGQEIVSTTIDDLEIMPSIAQAKQIREYEAKGELTCGVADVILKAKNSEDKPVSVKVDKKLFPKNYSKQEMTDLISKLLTEYFEKGE